ncbi:MAG: phage tail protein [Actinobacteria bacterium]|jgi:phage tail-like protein|nr:phage tail protein [Actinomycetota bacterium]NCG38064.1 phage tail protein [Actinomycetota bacterium]
MSYSGLDTGEEGLQGFAFMLEVDGQAGISYFTKCSGLSIDIEGAEHKTMTPSGAYIKVMIPGRTSYGDIELSRGLTSDTALEDWADQVATGDITSARCDGAISIMSLTGEVVAQFEFKNGWPSKWSGPSMSATSTEAAVESLTISHENLVRVQ